MSVTIDSWCSECCVDRSKKFKSMKDVKSFDCPVCGQRQSACNLCDLMDVTHCGDDGIADGGCAFLYADGSIRDRSELPAILFDRKL